MYIRYYITFICLLSAFAATGQVLTNIKGTRLSVDTSKWRLSGADMYNKNTGNVGIGLSLPLYKLDVSATANPLRLTGLQAGAATDSVLTVQNGVVRFATIGRLITDTSLYDYDGTLTGNRTVTFGSNSLSLATGGSAFTITGLTGGTLNDSLVTISTATGRINRMTPSLLLRQDSTTASNGLSLSTKDVRLGGNLTQATTITSNANTLTFATGGTALNITGLPGGAATDSVLTINTATGQLRSASVTRMVTDSNIYRNNGTITSNRTVTMGANNLIFTATTGDLIYNPSGGGNMGIGTASPASASIVDMTSTTAGVLVPRMTTAQRTAIASPVNGLLVYDITTNCFWVYKGSIWVQIVSGAPSLNPNNGGAAYTTAAYTLQPSDNGSILEFNNASGVALTVPSGLPAGFQCSITQLGAGAVTVSAGAGMTVRNAYNYTKTAAQYSKIGIEITSTATVAILSGDAQ